jgi:hypothetical protein
MWRTIPVALFCWLILIASVRAQDVFVPRELKPKSIEKSDKSSADQTVSEKAPAPHKQSEAATILQRRTDNRTAGESAFRKNSIRPN